MAMSRAMGRPVESLPAADAGTRRQVPARNRSGRHPEASAPTEGDASYDQHRDDCKQQHWNRRIDLARGVAFARRVGASARWLPRSVDRPFRPAGPIVELEAKHARAAWRRRVERYRIARDPNHRWPVRLRERGRRLPHQSKLGKRPTPCEGVTLCPAFREVRLRPSIGRVHPEPRYQCTAAEESEHAEEQRRSNAHGRKRTLRFQRVIGDRATGRGSLDAQLAGIGCPHPPSVWVSLAAGRTSRTLRGFGPVSPC